MAHTAFIRAESKLCIHGSGQASVGQYQSCTWVTPNGVTAVLVVTNGGGTSALTIVISGAPPEIFATDGSPLNGQHLIPANQPTANVTAIGDFKGQQVMVFNMSNPAVAAQVVTSAWQPC